MGPVDPIETTSSDAASPAFNSSTTIMGSNNSATTAASGNTTPHTVIGSTVGTTTTPSLISGTGFNYSSANATVNTLTDTPHTSDMTNKNGMTNNDTSSDLQTGNETEIQGSIPSSTSSSSPSTKSVNVSVGSAMTERNGHATKIGPVKITTVPQQMETSGKIYSTANDTRHETTVEPTGMPPTTSGQKESKGSTNVMPTVQPPVSETLPMQPTSQDSKTTPTVTSKGSEVTSSITVALSTIHTRASTMVKAAATSSTTISKTTTFISVQHSEGNLANTKKMVNGKPVSSPNGTKVDPLVIGMITVFFIIIGIVSILGFLKYRQRNSQPEFRRLHELPMDDMMEEDTPLSLYSY
ncbi:mucin-5AC-like isoform X2 [Carcharodon carcharias]|nr:mucin-5AC-like isoform X2 [Carcharodon carcharias]XP_041063918.1 mucin-5AC-like isoform X2 [Carcharodon carcharias]XP_041063919.1 mucin-5AC-like isoform X2 [Carcharodon carcharias]XP_041063920.1 mucin-5AC-like isoform X2 [Carcharodon carcharias]XP_041063921.1 mucin-5AC-like isoform X2 [Carcharodon carcharias]